MWKARKPFEQDLHDKFDKPAKDVVAGFINSTTGLRAEPNPDQYGVDLLLFRDGVEVGGVEVEVRQWSPVCPYNTIHIPHRKHKFFGKRVLFFALTKDMRSAYWIETADLEQYPLKEVSNYKIRSGEYFFDVPTDKFNHVIFGGSDA